MAPPQQLRLFNEDGEIPESVDEFAEKKKRHEAAKKSFDNWIAGRSPAFRPNTIKVYRALWEKYLKFQDDKKLSWRSTTPEIVKEFLKSLTDSKLQHRIRYQNVLERAFDEISELKNTFIVNPASRTEVAVQKGKEWRDAEANDPTQFLGNMDQLILRDRLIMISNTLTNNNLTPPARWRRSRDTAIVTALFACGIKPAELMVLSVNCIILLEKGAYLDTGCYQGLAVQERTGTHNDPNKDATHAYKGADVGPNRKVFIPPWAHLILSQWLSIRSLHSPAQEAIGRLFPGNRKITNKRTSSLMNPATLARIVTKWGRDHAELELTPQRLRNTFGASLVRAGEDLPVIESKMGYATGAASAFRLKQAWLAWCALHNR